MKKMITNSLAKPTDACTVSIESFFLSLLVQTKGPVSVHLRNGIRLKGRLVIYDEKFLFLQNETQPIQAILKNAVSTVTPIVKP